MSIHFDFDADTGVTTTFDFDPIQDQALLTYTQDVTFFLDRMKDIRNNPDISATGIKEDWWHYASIPPVVEIALRNKGLKLECKDHHKAIFQEINKNFSYLKATDKTHS